MFHPFELIPAGWRARVLVPLAVLTLAVSGWLVACNFALMNPTAPAGLWSLASARDGYGAREIIDAWDVLSPGAPKPRSAGEAIQQLPRGLVDRALGLAQMRFPLIFLYAFTLSLACAWLAVPARMPVAGFSLSIAVWIAALLHAVENMAVLRMLLSRNPGDAEAVMASTCFAARTALLVLVFAWIVWAWWRVRSSSNPTFATRGE